MFRMLLVLSLTVATGAGLTGCGNVPGAAERAMVSAANRAASILTVRAAVQRGLTYQRLVMGDEVSLQQSRGDLEKVAGMYRGLAESVVSGTKGTELDALAKKMKAARDFDLKTSAASPVPLYELVSVVAEYRAAFKSVQDDINDRLGR